MVIAINKKQQGSKVEGQKSQVESSQVGKKTPAAKKAQDVSNSKISYPKFDDDKKEATKTAESAVESGKCCKKDCKKECKKDCGKCCKEGQCCMSKKECTKCEKTCNKKECDKKKKCCGIVRCILLLAMLLAITLVQAVYFIVEVDGVAGNKFFASIKRYFISHPDCRIWLRFATLFTTLFELVVVAFRLMNFAAFILNCSIKLVFKIVACLIVPLALVISMVFIMNYVPDIIPSQVQVITNRIPKLPENIKAKIDPVVRYITSANFQENIDRYVKAVMGVFKRK